jgi:hypothetical protein
VILHALSVVALVLAVWCGLGLLAVLLLKGFWRN